MPTARAPRASVFCFAGAAAALLGALVILAAPPLVRATDPPTPPTDPPTEPPPTEPAPPPPPAWSLIREPAFNPSAPLLGRVRLVDPDGNTVQTWTSPQPNDMFGLSAIVLPDVNGDGIPDAAIAAPNAFDEQAGMRIGTIRIASGADGSTIATLFGTPLDRFGLTMFAAVVATSSSVVLTTLVELLDPATNAPYAVRAFTFQSFDAFTGAFLGETLQAPSGFTHQAARDSLATHVRAAGPADLNADGEVGAWDLSILAGNYGTAVDPVTGELLQQTPGLAAAPTGDTNGDGVVNEQDLATVLGSFGQSTDPSFAPVEGVLTEAEASAIEGAFEMLIGSPLDCSPIPGHLPGRCRVPPDYPLEEDDVDPFDEVDGDDDDGTNPGGSGNPSPPPDQDGDGIPDASDPDRDGDGIPNEEDGYDGPGPVPPSPDWSDGNPHVRLRADFDRGGSIDTFDDALRREIGWLRPLTTRGDSDGDAWPDFVDGFNYLEGADFDDECSAQFTLVELELTDVETGTVTIAYPAADPRSVDFRHPMSLPLGNQRHFMRLWRKAGDQRRDPRPITEGGDYIPPGEYAPSDLGIPAFGDSGTLFYLECTAGQTGAFRLGVSIRAPEESGRPGRWIGSSVLGIAPDEIAIYPFPSGGIHQSFGTLGVEPTPRYSLDDVPDFEALWLVYQPLVYRITAWCDEIVGVTVGGVWLGVDGARTELFWIDDPGDAVNPNPGPSYAVAIPGAGVEAFEVRYFVAGPLGVAIPVDAGKPATPVKKITFPRDKDPNVVMFKLLDEATDTMEADTANAWRNTYTTAEDGAFGKEVHKRISARVAGKDRWVTNVWVKKSDNTIVNIGSEHSPPGFLAKDVKEVDALKLKKGKTITVGQVLSSDVAEQAFEIKTSVRGALTEATEDFYDSLFGPDGWHIMNPKRRFTDTGGWARPSRSSRNTISFKPNTIPLPAVPLRWNSARLWPTMSRTTAVRVRMV